MAKAYVALGANLGQAQQALKDVIDRINEEDEVVVIKTLVVEFKHQGTCS